MPWSNKGAHDILPNLGETHEMPSVWLPFSALYIQVQSNVWVVYG